MHYFGRKCACRRELNRHGEATPRVPARPGIQSRRTETIDRIEQPDFNQGRRERRPVQTHEDAARDGDREAAARYGQAHQRSDESMKNFVRAAGLSACKELQPQAQAGGPSCKAQGAMHGTWQAPQTRRTATALAVPRSGEQNGPHANTGLSSYSARCCLTPRSSGAPTAGHQRPVGGTRYIFTARALASCRRHPLSSNVRPHRTRPDCTYAQLSHEHPKRLRFLLPRLTGPQAVGSGIRYAPSQRWH